MTVAHASDLQFWVVLWAAAAFYLGCRHWRSGAGVGILLTYVLSFGVLYWLDAALHLLPWFFARNANLVAEGMRLSALGLVALAVGAEVGAWGLRRRAPAPATSRVPAVGRPVESQPTLDRRGVRLLLIAGLVLYGVLSRALGSIPSLAAIVSTGSTVLIAAISLEVWSAWQAGERGRMVGWLLGTTALPLLTVVTQGFLGYGFAAMLAIMAFAGSFLRPRWRVLVVGLALGYVGLSVFVTYARDRNDIREVVWGGSGFTDRVERIQETFSAFEWFNVEDMAQLERVDLRLDQDLLVGAAAAHLNQGFVPFAGGATIVDAALAIVPRAFWPGKPVVGGSGDVVSTYTGFRFAEGTSVGVGQVLEFYVNFGLAGVLVGFGVLGATLAVVDRFAARALADGDVFRFVKWYFPGLGLLQVGGSLAEMVSTAAAGLVTATLLGAFARRFLPRATAEPPALARSASEERL